MRHLIFGLILASNLLGCATDSFAFGRKRRFEPSIERCIHNEDGSAECKQKDGSWVTKQPAELENYLSTNPMDMEVYRNFCLGKDQYPQIQPKH